MDAFVDVPQPANPLSDNELNSGPSTPLVPYDRNDTRGWLIWPMNVPEPRPNPMTS